MSDLYIDSPQQLAELCDTLRGHDWLTLDTEFIREKNYYPRLCLIQVANPDVVACVDPLAIDDLGPLLDVLYDPAITKVLHAARQDLEIFYQLRGAVPAKLFDTQIAATILGQGDQVGYGNLVRAELGIQLDKGHARTDWCRRPLDAEQLKYAADDVRYLRDVYHQQLERLTSSGRLQWLDEDFAELGRPELYDIPLDEAWRKVKSAGRLKGAQLAVLQKLAAWREESARNSDRPKRWILKDELLLELAKQMPGDQKRMQRIRGLEEGFLKRHGQTLQNLISEAKNSPREQWPQLEQGERPAPEQEPLVDLLMALLRERCRQAEISPTVVAGRRDLERLVLGERELPVMHGWRASIAGEALRQLLDGTLQLGVHEGRLDCSSAE